MVILKIRGFGNFGNFFYIMGDFFLNGLGDFIGKVMIDLDDGFFYGIVIV